MTSDNPIELAKQIISKGLSVRAAEALAKAPKPAKIKTNRPKIEKDADTRALEGDLSANLGMKVQIDHASSGETGTITVRYKSLDDLDILCGKLST